MNFKIDAIYGALLSSGSNMRAQRSLYALEDVVRKAISDLEETKKSFKSKQIMRIKEELKKALERSDP